MRIAFFIVLMLFAVSAHAQKVISNYDPASSIGRTDKLLLQQGDATMPYTYGTPDQLFLSMRAQDVLTALGFAPLPSSGGTISGSLSVMQNLTVSGSATIANLSLASLTSITVSGAATVGSLSTSGLATLSGGIVATSLPTSCSSKPTGTVWNNGNVLSICP